MTFLSASDLAPGMHGVIGRDAELGAVHAFLDRPSAVPRALVIEGGAGIGKSTLWLEAVAAARRLSFEVMVSRPAETEQTLPNVVLGDLFGGTDPELLASLPRPQRTAFEAALLLGDAPSGRIDPRALGVAVASLLPILAQDGPLVLAIDDDQWLDASSAATLEFALRRASTVPLVLLLARRTGDGPTAGVEAALEADAVEHLRVGPLTVGALQLVIRRRLGVTFSRPIQLQIHEVSGGNALHALELARARSADPARDIALPLPTSTSLEQLVGSRVDALADDTRRTLLLAAAHGRLPMELLGPLDVSAGSLEDAISAGIIETPRDVVQFTHPLLASGVYHGATPQTRRAAHRRLAGLLNDPVQRGRHLALGADEPDSGIADAIGAAADAAWTRGMAVAAAELSDHALYLTPVTDAQGWHQRAILAARRHGYTGDWARARRIGAEVLERAQPGVQRAEALQLAAEEAAPSAGIDLLRTALTEASAAPALRVAIHASLADLVGFTEGAARAEPHANAALRLAEQLGDDAARANAMAAVARIAFDRARPGALDLARGAHDLAGSLGDIRLQQLTGETLAHLLAWAALHGDARAWLTRDLATWRDRDDQARSNRLWYLSLVEVWAGRYDVAERLDEERDEIDTRNGIEIPAQYIPTALLAMYRGDLATARDVAMRALRLTGWKPITGLVSIVGTCELWSGNPRAALVELERAEKLADARDWDEPSRRRWRPELVEAWLQVGRIDEAAALVATWEAAALRLGRERVVAEARRSRGQIAAAHGDLAAAAAHLEAAVDLHEAAEDPFGRGRALLSRGAVLRRARQKRSARESIATALSVFVTLGAAGWATTARAELGRIGGRERIEGLSPSERRVAELVAAGRTNREIASELFLGERTVTSHLTHAYAKLGIRSRTELARKLSSAAGAAEGDEGNIPTS